VAKNGQPRVGILAITVPDPAQVGWSGGRVAGCLRTGSGKPTRPGGSALRILAPGPDDPGVASLFSRQVENPGLPREELLA
jgi:hypothetical protein